MVLSPHISVLQQISFKNVIMGENMNLDRYSQCLLCLGENYTIDSEGRQEFTKQAKHGCSFRLRVFLSIKVLYVLLLSSLGIL